MDEIIDKLYDSFDTEEKVRRLYYGLFVKSQGKLTVQEVIEKYEKYKEILEENEFDPEMDVFVAVMRITALYANALKSNGNIRKAIPYLSRAISLYDECEKTKKGKRDNKKSPTYEVMRWGRANSYYQTKQFRLAYQDFKYLAKTHPENEKYKLWRDHTFVRRFVRIQIVFMVAVLIPVVEYVFMKSMSPELKSVNDKLIVVAVLGSVSFELWRYFAWKRLDVFIQKKL